MPKPSQAKRGAAVEEGAPVVAAATDAQLLPHVVHVSPDSRKVRCSPDVPPLLLW